MKIKRHFISLFTLFTLTSCGTLSLSGNGSGSSSTPALEQLDAPNAFVLRSIARMVSSPSRSTSLTFASDALISSRIELPGYETESSFDFDVTGQLAINQDQGFQEAQLNLAINRLALSSTTSAENFTATNELVFENETADLYFDATTVYVQLSPGATDIPQFLFPSANRTFPNQFKSPFVFENEIGTLTPTIQEADIDAWVDAMLPMVDSLSLLQKSLNGSDLIVTYEITQDDLFAIFERMYLGTSSRENLSEEENAGLDAWLQETVNAYTLNRFVLSVTLNTLSNLITDVLIDIDWEFDYAFSLSYVEYDPENPEADENGYVNTGRYFLNWTYLNDIFFEASIEVFESPFDIIAPVNKEDYEWIELLLEDPNLV